MEQRVLGLLAKWPRPGQVKSRLAAETSPEWACRVADAFLRDTVERLALISARRILAYAPREAVHDFSRLAGERFALVPQAAGDLGQRMSAFFSAVLQGGANSAVLVGADSPTLPLERIEQAFRKLEHADLVLGPATDGGYYLIGVARRLPPIFDGITWGGPRVLAQTVARLESQTTLALLPPWYDVDTLADWRMLQGHLAACRRAGIDPHLPHTTALAESVSEHE